MNAATKLTLICFEGRAAFANLPVGEDGEVRITASEAARVCGVPERTPEQLRAGCLPVGEAGWASLNPVTPHNAVPMIFVGKGR